MAHKSRGTARARVRNLTFRRAAPTRVNKNLVPVILEDGGVTVLYCVFSRCLEKSLWLAKHDFFFEACAGAMHISSRGINKKVARRDGPSRAHAYVWLSSSAAVYDGGHGTAAPRGYDSDAAQRYDARGSAQRYHAPRVCALCFF